ncbi:MAG: type I secretion C-terminal target domain-containing protein, partial [Azoarcus sp.]|nr:type I secretion C-terminal target domain-containing protein [Azoarcus sp.]
TATIDITDTVPVAVDDDYGTVRDDVRTAGNVIDNDQQSADAPVVVSAIRSGATGDEVDVTGPYTSSNHQHATLETEHGGLVWINPDGSFQYLAPWDYAGPDSFQYQLVDADGSKSDWATVSFNAPVPDHVILGGVDHTDLVGSVGADVFQWQLSDVRGTGPVTNTVTDFNASEGDRLDLRDLLADGTDDLHFDTGHLSVTSDGGSTTITVSPVDVNAPDLNIVIEGVDLTGGNTGQAAIDHMLNNGTLVDDK